MTFTAYDVVPGANPSESAPKLGASTTREESELTVCLHRLETSVNCGPLQGQLNDPTVLMHVDLTGALSQLWVFRVHSSRSIGHDPDPALEVYPGGHIEHDEAPAAANSPAMQVPDTAPPPPRQ